MNSRKPRTAAVTAQNKQRYTICSTDDGQIKTPNLSKDQRKVLRGIGCKKIFQLTHENEHANLDLFYLDDTKTVNYLNQRLKAYRDKQGVVSNTVQPWWPQLVMQWESKADERRCLLPEVFSRYKFSQSNSRGCCECLTVCNNFSCGCSIDGFECYHKESCVNTRIRDGVFPAVFICDTGSEVFQLGVRSAEFIAKGTVVTPYYGTIKRDRGTISNSNYSATLQYHPEVMVKGINWYVEPIPYGGIAGFCNDPGEDNLANVELNIKSVCKKMIPVLEACKDIERGEFVHLSYTQEFFRLKGIERMKPPAYTDFENIFALSNNEDAEENDLVLSNVEVPSTEAICPYQRDSICWIPQMNSPVKLLNNPGWNVCYANSVIQFLSHDELVNHITSFIKLAPSFGQFNNGMYLAMSSVFNDMAFQREVDVRGLITWMTQTYEIQSRFQSETQNDACDFFEEIISRIMEELDSVNKVLWSSDIVSWMQLEFKRLIMFHTHTTKHYSCNSCNYNKRINAPDEDQENQFVLVLGLPEPNLSLQECFHKYSNNISTTKVPCPNTNCSAVLSINETVSFLTDDLKDKMLPDLLHIQLKISFDRNQEDNWGSVFNEHDPSSMYLFVADKKNRIEEYETFSFICHQGLTPEDGHYVTFYKKDNKWVLLNDTIIETMSTSEMFCKLREFQFVPYVIALKRFKNVLPLERRLTLTGNHAALNAALTSLFGLNIERNCENIKTLSRQYYGNTTRPNTNLLAYKIKIFQPCDLRSVFDKLVGTNQLTRSSIIILEIQNDQCINNLSDVLKIAVATFHDDILRKDLVAVFNNADNMTDKMDLSDQTVCLKENMGWKLNSLILREENCKVLKVIKEFENDWYCFQYDNSMQNNPEFAERFQLPAVVTLSRCNALVLKFIEHFIVSSTTSLSIPLQLNELSSNAGEDTIPDDERNEWESDTTQDDDNDVGPDQINSIIRPHHTFPTFKAYIDRIETVDKDYCSICGNEDQVNFSITKKQGLSILGALRLPPSVHKSTAEKRFVDMELTKLVQENPNKLKHYLEEHQSPNPTQDLTTFCQTSWANVETKRMITEIGESKGVYSFECNICGVRYCHIMNIYTKICTPAFHYQLFHSGPNQVFVKNPQRFPTFDMYWEEVLCLAEEKLGVGCCPICGDKYEEGITKLDNEQVKLLDPAANTLGQVTHFLHKHHVKPKMETNYTILNHWAQRSRKHKMDKPKDVGTIQSKSKSLIKMPQTSVISTGNKNICHICGIILPEGSKTRHNNTHHFSHSECFLCHKTIGMGKSGTVKHFPKCQQCQTAIQSFNQATKKHNKLYPSKRLQKSKTLGSKVSVKLVSKMSSRKTRSRAPADSENKLQ